MSSKLPWPNSNTRHYRPSSPQLTSPVILLVDDTNMQPTKRPYREQFAEQAEPEQRDGVDIVLMTRRASSRYLDDGNTGKAAGASSAPPMERESLYEDDIPDSGENTSCDEAQPGKIYEAKKASIQPGHSRTNASFYPPPPRRGSNARRNLIKASNFPESVYSIEPPGTDPASPGPSRESAYSVAGGSGPGGKLPAYYSLANWEQLASPPATATTFFSEKSTNSASCWPAPLQPSRNSGSTTTRDSDLISDAELSQRTSTTTTCSSSLRSSGRRSNKLTRPPSAASRRDSLPAHEERYSARSKISRTSDGRQIDGWPSSARTSGGSIPLSERKPEPRRVNIRDSLPISERSPLQGPSAPPGTRRAPAARTQPKRPSRDDQSMVTIKIVDEMDVRDLCYKCYGPRVTHLKDMDQSKPGEIAKRSKIAKRFLELGLGRETRCYVHQKRRVGHREKCVEHGRCVGRGKRCDGLHKACGAYQKTVSMSRGETRLAELRVANGSNEFELPNSLAGSIPLDSVVDLFPWEWI